MLNVDDCRDPIPGNTHVCEHHKKSFELVRPQKNLQVFYLNLDQCRELANTERCDCVYEVERSYQIFTAIYVELKGRDFEKGIRQLISTIEIFGERHHSSQKQAFFIGKRIPRVDTRIQKMKIMFLKKYHTKFFPKTNKLTYTINLD